MVAARWPSRKLNFVDNVDVKGLTVMERPNLLRRIWWTLSTTTTRWSGNDGTVLAAATAYYAAFSFFPLLLVLISALGFALRFSVGAQDAQRQILEVVSHNATPVLADEVRSILGEVTMRATVSGPVGLATLLLGAIGIFTQIDLAFDRIWQKNAHREHGVWAAVHNALWTRLKAFLVLIGLGLLVLIAQLASVTVTALETWSDQLSWEGLRWDYVHLIVSVTINAMIFSLLYKVMPKAQVRWRDALLGGSVVAIVWQVGSQVLAYFVVRSNYTAHGVVGSFIAVMLWVYCASSLLYFGAQMVQVLGYPEERAPP